MEKTEEFSKVAFSIGPISVAWYGIIIGAAILLALWLAIREGKRRGMNEDFFADLLLWALPMAILGARAYYVIFSWDYYSMHPERIIKIWEGGMAIHGGLIAAIITGAIFCKKRNVSFWKVADIVAPSIIIAQSIGRWGNFMNQEAHGGEVTRIYLENLHIPEFIINRMYINGAYYEPTFLYESLWSLLGFIVLIALRRVNLRRGEMFLTYAIWYSVGRFFIEGLRTDSLMIGGFIRTAQLISLITIIGALAIGIYRRMTAKKIVRYLDK